MSVTAQAGADPPSHAPASRWVGVSGIAASACTLFAMALVAAGRGSPYQPVLTPNGRAKGWLRDLARSVGLEDLHGNPSLAVGVLAALAAVAGFLWLLRTAWRGQVGVATVALIVVAGHLMVLFVPLLFSRDVYSYAYYGRIAGIYGGNPYVETPLDHSGDLLWSYVGPRWIDTPAVYGPAWTALSAGLSRVLPKPVDHVVAYRYLAIAASLATCVALVLVVRQLCPARGAFALAAFGANPIVLFHSVASGHNDLLITFAVVCALGLVLARHDLGAVVVLTIGASVKATAALPLLLLLVWICARHPPGRRRRALLVHGGAAVAIGLAFAVPYLQMQDPTLGMLGLAGHEGWLAPSAVLGRIVDVVSFGTLGWTVRVVFGLILVRALFELGREVWRRGAAGAMTVAAAGAAWGWSLVLLALLAPVLLPWYVVWALPLVWLLPRPARLALMTTSVLLAVTLWSAEPLRFPGAFELNLFLGRWLVTPVLLVLALRALRDLRRRADLGLAFAERRVVPGERRSSDREQHVAEAAGHR